MPPLQPLDECVPYILACRNGRHVLKNLVKSEHQLATLREKATNQIVRHLASQSACALCPAIGNNWNWIVF